MPHTKQYQRATHAKTIPMLKNTSKVKYVPRLFDLVLFEAKAIKNCSTVVQLSYPQRGCTKSKFSALDNMTHPLTTAAFSPRQPPILSCIPPPHWKDAYTKAAASASNSCSGRNGKEYGQMLKCLSLESLLFDSITAPARSQALMRHRASGSLTRPPRNVTWRLQRLPMTQVCLLQLPSQATKTPRSSTLEIDHGPKATLWHCRGKRGG